MMRLFILAMRNVTRNRRRTAVTVLAVAVGVAGLITYGGFTQGYFRFLEQVVVEGNLGALQVHRVGYLKAMHGAPLELNMPYTPELVDRIRKVPGVRAVTGRILFTGLISNGITQTTFVGRAYDYRSHFDVCPNAGSEVSEGENLGPDDVGRAVVGLALAKGLKAGLGGALTLSGSSPEGRANSMEIAVKGLGQSGMAFDNKRVLVVPLPFAQSLLGMEQKVTELAIRVYDVSKVEEIQRALQAELGPEYEVHTWLQVAPIWKDVADFFAGFAAMVGGFLFGLMVFVVANTLVMCVFEREREIGTMLAVGMKRVKVGSLFVWEAMILGTVGAAIGVFLGWAVITIWASEGVSASRFGFNSTLLLRPWASTLYMVEVAVAAIVVAGAAGTWPAWRASKANPVDALRGA